MPPVLPAPLKCDVFAATRVDRKNLKSPRRVESAKEAEDNQAGEGKTEDRTQAAATEPGAAANPAEAHAYPSDADAEQAAVDISATAAAHDVGVVPEEKEGAVANTPTVDGGAQALPDPTPFGEGPSLGVLPRPEEAQHKSDNSDVDPAARGTAAPSDAEAKPESPGSAYALLFDQALSLDIGEVPVDDEEKGAQPEPRNPTRPRDDNFDPLQEGPRKRSRSGSH
eukprot:scaffold3037_cov230-Pinguiococcus_pyrenoidosus.AAC.4